MATTRHKDFGAPLKVSDFEPVTFVLCEQEFACHPAVQGAVLLRFIADADSKDGGRAAEAMRWFFTQVMSEEEVERFYALIDGDEYVIDMQQLAEITSWLVEVYSSRPTEPSKPSRNGRKKAGTTSMAVVS